MVGELESPTWFLKCQRSSRFQQQVRFPIITSLPTGFTEDKWVEKVEIRPGNRSVVYHMIASVQAHNARLEKFAHGKFFDLDGDPNRPGADKTRMFSASPDGELLHVYVPGGVAPVLQPGQARLIKANSDITLQVHYTSI